MIAQYLLALAACLLLLACVHLMDSRDPRMPSRKQLRHWRKERYAVPRTWNRWRR